MMAFLETVLVARANRRRDEPPIDSDQELLAVGVAALAGGLHPVAAACRRLLAERGQPPLGRTLAGGGPTTAVLAVLVAALPGTAARRPAGTILASMVLVATIGLLDPEALSATPASTGPSCGSRSRRRPGPHRRYAPRRRRRRVAHLRPRHPPDQPSRVRPLYARPGGGWTTDPARRTGSPDQKTSCSSISTDPSTPATRNPPPTPCSGRVRDRSELRRAPWCSRPTTGARTARPSRCPTPSRCIPGRPARRPRRRC